MIWQITQNWRGMPLTDRISMVESIGVTKTKTGWKVECVLDTVTYEKGVRVSEAKVASLDISGDSFHPECNDTIKPRRRQNEKLLTLWASPGTDVEVAQNPIGQKPRAMAKSLVAAEPARTAGVQRHCQRQIGLGPSHGGVG